MPRSYAEINSLRDEARRELSRLYERANGSSGDTREWISQCYDAFDNQNAAHLQKYLVDPEGDKKRCKICLTLIPKDQEYDFCGACVAEELVRTCQHCDGVFESSRLSEVTIDGETTVICEGCLEEFRYCDHCEEYFSTSDGEEDSNGRFLCDSCREDYFICDECGHYTHTDCLHSDEDGEGSYCEDCYTERFFCCRGCHDTFSVDERHEHRGYYYCEECHAEHGLGPINHYHGTRRWWNTFLGKGEKAGSVPTFGVELEVVCRGGRRIEIAKKLVADWGKFDGKDLFFLENDGSIGDAGFEMIFHPFSIKALAEGLAEHLRKMLTWLAKEGVVSYQATDEGISCGIHISVGRGPYLGPFAEYKLQRLVYENPVNILSVSQRRKGDIERWASPFGRKGNIRHEKESALLAMKKISGHKYCALHFRESGETIECRIFRGTLFFPSFMKNIEFLAAAVEFARCADYGMREAAWKNFISFSLKHKKQYPNWIRFAGDTGNLEELTVIPPSKTRRRS